MLVQGAGGGVATALIVLGRAAGLRVWATRRSEAKRARARRLGADAAFEPGARLPERVDAVAETVGAATWDHSLKSLKPGGVLVISGATSGRRPARGPEPRLLPAALGGRLDDGHARRARPAGAAVRRARRPAGDRVDVPMEDARAAFEALAGGDVFGKLVLRAESRRTGGATFPGCSRRRRRDLPRLLAPPGPTGNAAGQTAPVHPVNKSSAVCKSQSPCGS